MADKIQKMKAKCPYCGFDNEIKAPYKEQSEPIALGRKFLPVFRKPELDEDVKWLAHRCVNCPESFEYHVETKEIR